MPREGLGMGLGLALAGANVAPVMLGLLALTTSAIRQRPDDMERHSGLLAEALPPTWW
jgi:hypothetical protein